MLTVRFRQISVGPNAIVSIMVGEVLSQFSPDAVEQRQAFAATLCLLVGIFTFLLGLFRFGFIDSVFSRPLFRGLVFAIVFLLISEQMPNFFGIPLPPHETLTSLGKAIYVLTHLGLANLRALAIGAFSLAFLLGHRFFKEWSQKKWVSFVPAILIAVVVNTTVCWALELDKYGVTILGKIEGHVVSPTLPVLSFDIVSKAASVAVAITIMGFAESLMIAKTFACKYNYSVSANRELVALGAANICGSFFGSYPSFGSFSRSGVNDAAGARSQISAALSSLVVLITVAFLLPLFYYLPRAVTAAIVINAAINLIDFKDCAYIIRMHAIMDGLLLILTFVATIFGLEVGLSISIGASMLLVLKHTALPRLSVLGRISGTDQFADIAAFPEAVPVEGLLILKIEEPLYFANTGQIKDLLRRIEILGDRNAHPSEQRPFRLPSVTAVIFDLKAMPTIDKWYVERFRFHCR